MELTFQVPMQYGSLQHQTLLPPLDTTTTGHCFCFGSASYILSIVISSLFPNSILETYQPGVLIFQHHIFWPFHTVHRIIKARIVKWFLPFPSPVDHILSGPN